MKDKSVYPLLSIALCVCVYTHIYIYCMHTQSLSYVQLCNPMDYKLLGSSVHGIFQGKIMEWVAMSFSRGSSQPRDQTHTSHILYAEGRWILYQ